jgi:casein kinase II subunit beta
MSARGTWLTKFLEEPRNRLLVRVDDEFLHNSFNITGAKQQLSHFGAAYELLRRGVISAGLDVDQETVEREAEILYFILHHRFILTRPGMQLVYQKFEQNLFQTCPRVNCRGAQCLPYGISEQYGKFPLKWYCVGCGDLYNVNDPDLEKLDGSAFGPSWVHMFVQKFPRVVPPGPGKVYVPKIFGFRIAHEEPPEGSDDACEE